jgi:aminoglycoside phosphotransferase (APT) family kinase protein
MQDLQKIAEGSEAEIFAWEDGTVLRLMRDPEAGEAVEWQAQAMEAARASGVRVPAVHGTTTVQGRPGLIMERVDGPDMLTLVGARPWTIFSVGAVSGKVHAQMHSVQAPTHLRDLRAALREAIDSSELVPRHLAEFALSVLKDLPDRDILCHGDFHPGNIIDAGGEPVVIDWTNVTRGDPAADFARTNLLLRLGEPPPGSSLLLRVLALVGRKVLLAAYRRAYRRVRAPDEALVTRWEVPVMAHRLVENYESERPALLRLLEERRAAGG